MTSLRLVAWVTSEEHASLLAGGAVATVDPQAGAVARFCARNKVPWSETSFRVCCFAGPVPRSQAARHRGLVRLELDVAWLLEDLRLAVDGPIVDLALVLAARQDRGDAIWRDLRRFRVLGGAPADRGDALLAVARSYVGSHAVEARLFRPVHLDDIDTWIQETGLPIVGEA